MFKKKLFSILISLVIAIFAVIVNPAVSALASIHKNPYPFFTVPETHSYDVVFTGVSGTEYRANSDDEIPYSEFDEWGIHATTDGPSIVITGTPNASHIYAVASSKKLKKVRGQMYRDIKGATKFSNNTMIKYKTGMNFSDQNIFEYIENDSQSFVNGTWKPKYLYVEIYSGKTSDKIYFDETGVHKKIIYSKSLSKPVDIAVFKIK
ncbi:MAG: hypothetical protein ACI4CS_00815 [Candidatus Weimeria sp.]